MLLLKADRISRVLSRAAAFGGSTIAAARFLFVLGLFLSLAAPARAQYLGSVNLQTVTQTLFPALTSCTGSAQRATINNLGQTSHAVTVSFTTSSPQVSYILEGSNDGVTFTRMSDTIQNGSTNSTTLQAAGYYTVVRFSMTCSSPGVFNVTYSGSGVPPGNLQGAGLGAEVEKLLFVGLATSNQNGSTFPPFGNMSGLVFITTSGSFSGGASLSLTCQYQAGNATAQTFALAGAGPLQFTVTAQPCVTVLWAYTFGTSTGTFNLEYVFSAGFSGASGTGSGGTATNVQGITGDQVAVGTTNPVLISGVTNSASSCVTCNLHISALGQNANDISGVGVFRTVGLAIGAGNLNPVNNTTGMTLPNNGPLGSALFATNTAVSTGTDVNVWASPPSGFSPGQTGAGATNTNPGGIMVNQNGFSQNVAVAGSASGTQTISNNTWNSGNFQSCYAQLDFTSITGAATVDVFVRTSLNGTNFFDRARFTLATSTAATQHQATGFGPTTAGLPAVPTQVLGTHSALASGSVNNGPIGGWLTFDWTTTLGGGTVTGMVVGIACY